MTTPLNEEWRKSSTSGIDGCVEVAHREQRVLVRDSKNPGGATLAVTESDWARFTEGVRSGEFMLPPREESALTHD